MTDFSELAERVRLITAQSRGSVSYKSTLASESNTPTARPTLVPQPGEWSLDDEPLTLIRMLAQAHPTSDAQTLIADTLIAHLDGWSATFVAHALIELNRMSELERVAVTAPESLREAFWRGVADKLRFESQRFGVEELAKFRYLAQAVTSIGAARQAIEVVDRINYLRLRTELLEGQNPEINTDQIVLIERVTDMGFDAALVAVLRELDKRIAGATSTLDFKSCMDLLRTALEALVKGAAAKTANKIGRPLPAGERLSHYQPWLQYLRNTDIKTVDEEAVLQKFYNYISNAGAHSLGSAPEQVRVSRNNAVEWMLLISGRVQGLLRG